MPALLEGLNELKVPFGKGFIRVAQQVPRVVELDYKLPKEMVVAAALDQYQLVLVIGVVQERVRLPMTIYRVDTGEVQRVPAKQVVYEILQAKGA